MVDELHQRIIDEALSNGNEEKEVKMTFGELVLFHSLMQNYGIEYTGKDRFIPLMERNKTRIDNAFGA